MKYKNWSKLEWHIFSDITCIWNSFVKSQSQTFKKRKIKNLIFKPLRNVSLTSVNKVYKINSFLLRCFFPAIFISIVKTRNYCVRQQCRWNTEWKDTPSPKQFLNWVKEKTKIDEVGQKRYKNILRKHKLLIIFYRITES